MQPTSTASSWHKAEEALDILVKPYPRCKKRHKYSNSSTIFVPISRSMPPFSALLQSAQSALVHVHE